MRRDERLAPAEHDVRHLVADDLADEVQGFPPLELVLQALSRRRLGAAMKAAEVAIAGDLPRHEERGPQGVDAIRRHGPQLQACSSTPQVNSPTATR
jgi:hypothetical protein